MPSSRPNEPWDADVAEALTRLYESGEGDPRKRPHGGDRAGAGRARADVPAPAGGNRNAAWLESRLGDIAARLQQSLGELDPDRALHSLNGRLDRLEERFTDALRHVARRADVEGLRLIEAHVTELSAHIEDARSQLARLDAIDGQVRGIARKLDGDGQPGPQGGDSQRLDALEGLLQDYIAEWRRGEAHTAGVLHTIEDVLARVADRMESIEAGSPAPQSTLSAFDALTAPERPGPHGGRDPLSVAYAEGARALGPKVYRSTLDAADYVPAHQMPAASEAAPGAAAAPVVADEPKEEAPARKEFRPASIRARLKTEPMPDQPVGVQAAQARAQAQSSPKGGPRLGLLLAAAMALLAGGGYLLVDVIMSRPGRPMPPAAAAVQRAIPQPEQGAAAQPAAAKPVLAEPGAQPGAGAPTAQPEAPAAQPQPDEQQELLPSPPRRRHAPETVTEDLSENVAPRAAGNGARSGGARSGGAEPVRAPQAQPAAAVQDAAPAAQPTTLQAILPPAIGPASLRLAAASGEPVAQFEVGARFAEGRGVEQDLAQASAWYQRAAMRGFAPAQFRLAMLYERGGGVGADVERARVWYARAAEQGHVKAMHNLAVLLAGSRSDPAAAAKWFAAAAERGLTDSQFNLAVLHMNGHGVAKDLPESYKWFALAARSGDKEAARRLEQVKAKLAAAEVEAAEAAVAAWRARPPEPGSNEMHPAASYGQ